MAKDLLKTKIDRGLGLLLLLSFLGSWLVAADLDWRKQRRSGEESSYLIPAERLRPFLLGYDLLAADFFWLETVQYVGKHLLTDREFPHLYPRLIRVISLDPHFLEVYRMGALFLAYSGGQVDAAILLLKKGAASNPERWEIPHDLGILCYLLKKDYPSALYWLERANRLPGRPDYVSRFVVRLYASTGLRETAIEMWIRIHDQTDLDWVKAIARRELKKLGAYLLEEGGR